MCPVTNCIATFESNIGLDAHIAVNQCNVSNENRQIRNDIARAHVTNILRSTSVQSRAETRTVIQHQATFSPNLLLSTHYASSSSTGWPIRTLKLSNPMSLKVKNFLEQAWQESINTNSRIAIEYIQEQIRSMRDKNGINLFQTHEYPTKNQIKYRLRKLNEEYGVTVKQQLTEEIIDDNTE